jgi:acyl-CoA synthetase (AMP-forming)/AMP-acid ligase II
MAPHDDALLDNIRSARTVEGIPPDRYLTEFSTIPSLLAHRAAASPDAPFLSFNGDGGLRRDFSYAAIYREACRTAHFLLRAGVRRGDRVATVAYNHSDTVVHYFACWCIGAVVVPVNVGEDDRRIAYILSNSGARLAFVRAEFAGRIGDILRAGAVEPHAELRVVVVGSPSGEFEKTVAAESDSPGGLPDVSPEDDALIVYTSGTTGRPKGVLLVQYNLLVDAKAIAGWHAMAAGDRMLCVLPIHHVNGIVVTLVTPLWYGGSVTLMRKFHTDDFWTVIAQDRVRVASVVPTLLQFLLHSRPPGPASPENPAGRAAAGLSQFRHIICGAGPLTCELAANFENAFGIPIVHGYGLSETTCYSCFLPLDLPADEHARWLRDYGFPSIGVPLPVNEMAIHDPSGRALGERERGEIVIRGHNVMREYFAEPAVNEKTFEHGWFRSGDEGFFIRDARGRPYFFITGRLKELIIRGGTNISPFEIDEVLMNIPGVRAGLAVGFDNDWYGEEVGAYVQRAEGSSVSEEQVIAECRKAFAHQKCPKVVLFGDDIPVTSTGKYQRNRLKPLFAGWKGVQFTESRKHQ